MVENTRQHLATDREVFVAGHVLFAVLLAIGTIRAALLISPPVAPMAGAAVLAAWYVLGAVRAGRMPRRRSQLWLLTLIGLWLALIVMSRDFVWLAFLLAMLLWHLFPARWAAPLAATVAAASVLAFRWHSGQWVVGAVVGPTLGVTTAVAVTLAYERLRAISEERRRLLAELTAAQQALAAREREAGRTAERERLARDIHDTIGQSLSSVILLLRAAKGPAAAHAPASCVDQLNTALNAASSALAETRRLVRGEQPAALAQGGLAQALAQQATDSAALGLPTTITVQGTPRRLDTSAEVALLRATQEALSNARKHAAAAQATVTLTFQDDEVSVDVVDDGVGFRPDTIRRHRQDGTGYGLTGMRARIGDRGGEVTIESEPGAGTAVRATIPTADHPVTA